MKKACSEIRLTLPGGIEMVLCRVECPKMGFRMGARGFRDSEEPVHTVVIPHVYYMGKYPVTQEQYCAVATRWRSYENDPLPAIARERGYQLRT